MALVRKNDAGVIVALYVTRAELDSLKRIAETTKGQFDPFASRFNGVPVYLRPEEVIVDLAPVEVAPWWRRAMRQVRQAARAVWFQLRWWATAP